MKVIYSIILFIFLITHASSQEDMKIYPKLSDADNCNSQCLISSNCFPGTECYNTLTQEVIKYFPFQTKKTI